MKKLCLILALCIFLCSCSSSPAALNCDNGHADEDNNGLCDRCDENVIVLVDVYTINDLHGKIADGENHPGVDELTTYLKDARESKENMILLSAGDMWQGTPESNLTNGLITTDWMNQIGFDAMALGNHEYDWGEEPIIENAELAEFPFLAINIYDRETDQQVEYCQSSLMIDVGQVQIGIIGAMGDCYSSISADKVEDIYFKVGDDLTRLVKAESEKLRSEGADYIIYVLHDGYGESTSSSVTSIRSSHIDHYYDTELSEGYVDLVFEGHSHQRYILKDEHGVHHFQNKGDNKGITHVQISINSANNANKLKSYSLVSTGKYARLEDDPMVEQLMEKYSEQVELGSKYLGQNKSERDANTLRNIVADLYYQKAEELWGDEYDIVLGGGFMSVRSPWTLSPGDVTYGMIYSLFPFDNQLVLCSIQGKDLKERFIETDNTSYFISYGAYGKSVKNNIDPNATYYIVTDTYSLVYKPNRLTEVARLEEKYYARDLLAEYTENGGFAK